LRCARVGFRSSDGEGTALTNEVRVLRTMKANNTVRWLWYAVIGVCLVVVIVTRAFFFPGKYNHEYDKWEQLAILTTTLFGIC
jgi:hypothetical protein